MSNLFYRFELGHHQQKQANKWNTWNIETATLRGKGLPTGRQRLSRPHEPPEPERQQFSKQRAQRLLRAFSMASVQMLEPAVIVNQFDTNTWVWHCFCTMRLAEFNSALWIVQLELKLVHVHLVWWSYDVSFAIIRPHVQISLVFVSLWTFVLSGSFD